jgi:hypothetical protein
MQQALRPYVTAGIALVGVSMIAVTPLVAPPPDVQVRPVQLVDAWTTLFTDTTANLDNIASNADASDITQVFSALFTNPLGVLDAITNLDPTVTTTTGTDPLLQVSVELTPALEYIFGQLGATGATIEAINGVVSQLQADPSNAFSILYEGTASVLNAYLNGADNVSLLGGIIDIPLYNGVLAPEQTASVDINLTDLVNALGLGNLNVSSLDLSSLLGQLGLGSLNLGQLFDALQLNGSPLSDAGLGTLLADASTPVTTLGGLLNLLGLGGLTSTDGLDLGSFSLTTLLTDLGLNPDVGGASLSTLLTELGLGGPTPVGLGTFLETAPGGIGTALGPVLAADPTLLAALNNVDLSDLVSGLNLGDGGTLDLSTLVTDLFTALGVSVPSTGDLTLASLLGDLDVDNLSVTSLLNTVTVGDLLGDLGLSNLPLNLSDLGDLSGLNLDGLLGDLGLGNLADVTVNPLGGLITELVDTVPQQILAAI